ncbi:MAG: CHAT domain-containing protein [Xenococcus sp. MO_188.B8]|nr:CHAT domain-containing protein [Xenococcus sp. MO_188.B8]
MTQPENIQSGSHKTILILASSPTDKARVRLGKEVQEIKKGLQRSKYKDEFTLEERWAVGPRDLHRALLDCNPQIVHFCGHASGENGLFLEDVSGKAQLVSTQALANLFKRFAERGLECVVLNACYTETQANEIAKHIDYVVAMNSAIGDNAAIQFAVGFYDELGAGWSYEDAYKGGCDEIALQGIPEEHTPVFKNFQKNSHASPSTSVFSEIARETYKKLKAFLKSRGRYVLSGLTPRFAHEGDLALVCEAMDEVLGRKVVFKALKLPDNNQKIHSNNEVEFQRFKEAVERGCKLSDEPNFMTIYDAHILESFDISIKENSVPYFVIQLIKGDSIRTHREHNTELQPREVRELILAIISSVVRIHNKGYCHGNIKPSNIMLRETPPDSVKLKNPLEKYEPFISPLHRYFSNQEELLSQLERRVENLENLDKLERKVKLNYILEDIAYSITPELFGPSQFDIDHKKTDQYMIGLLAYELLTNKLPCFLKEFDEDKFRDNPKEEFDILKGNLLDEDLFAFKDQTQLESVRDCPDSFKQAILKMISLEPSKRYNSLKDAGNVIERKYEYILAKESLARCLKKEDDFIDAFYDNFKHFTHNHEKFEAFFGSLKADEASWKNHRQVIKEAMLLLIAFHDQEEFSHAVEENIPQRQRILDENNILSRIAEKHVHFKKKEFQINQDDFKNFQRALICTICGPSHSKINNKSPFDEFCNLNKRGHTKKDIKDAW